MYELTVVAKAKAKPGRELDKHFTTLHAQTLLEKVPSLVAAPPEIMTYKLLSEDRADKSCF